MKKLRMKKSLPIKIGSTGANFSQAMMTGLLSSVTSQVNTGGAKARNTLVNGQKRLASHMEEAYE